MILVAITSFAQDIINGDSGRKKIVIGQTVPPPHALEMNEPVAMYCSSTDVIEITFDSNCYSHYTIQLEGMYATCDYYVFTPTVYLPVADMGAVVNIYIESNDYGSYYGVLDKTALTSME